MHEDLNLKEILNDWDACQENAREINSQCFESRSCSEVDNNLSSNTSNDSEMSSMNDSSINASMDLSGVIVHLQGGGVPWPSEVGG